MLGVLVDLGTELGVVLLRMEALVRVERKRRKRAVFCRREEGELGALSSGFSHSLWKTKRALEGGDCWRIGEALGWIFLLA